jgi:HSP20 family molecular chaperone IbpA
VKPEDVKIAVEGNILTIQGTKQRVAEERPRRSIATSVRTERLSGISRCPRP